MLFTISSISRTLFLVKSYYLINNHIEVTVLNQGQVTKQAAVIQISEMKQRFFFFISQKQLFLSRVAAEVCISSLVVTEDAKSTLG